MVLERAHRRHGLEVAVERRRAQPYLASEGLDAKRLCEVVLEPPDGPRDALGRGTGRSDLAKPRALLAGEHAVRELAEHERGKGRDVARALEQAHESEDRVEQGRLDRAHRQSAAGAVPRLSGEAPSATSSPTTAGSKATRRAR